MTVVLTLTAPSDGALSAFAGMYAPYIISPKAIKDNEQDGDWAQAWLRDNMVGTGPYILDSYSQSQQAVFSRNPDYWGGWDGEHFDQLIVSTSRSRPPSDSSWSRARSTSRSSCRTTPSRSWTGPKGSSSPTCPRSICIIWCCRRGKGRPRTRRSARRSPTASTTRPGSTTSCAGKRSRHADRFRATSSASTPTRRSTPTIQTRREQLLAEAGYPDGGFTINYTYETGYFWKRPLGELFQANMADLGITVDIQELSPSAWADLLSNPETANHAFGLVWWPTLSTPYDFMFSLFATGAQGTAGYNWGYYSNPELDALLDEGTAEPDEAKRMEIYAKAQDLLVDEAPALYVYEKRYRLPMRDTVEGFVFNGVYIETLNFYGMSKTG